MATARAPRRPHFRGHPLTAVSVANRDIVQSGVEHICAQNGLVLDREAIHDAVATAVLEVVDTEAVLTAFRENCRLRVLREEEGTP